MARAARNTAVVLALLLALPVSLGVSRLLPTTFDPVAAVDATVDRAVPLSGPAISAPVSIELVHQRVAARAVLGSVRDAAGRQPLRLLSALTAMVLVLLVVAARRDPSRVHEVGSPHLLRLASTSARRGPPVVA